MRAIDLIDRYEGFLLDSYGVLNDADRALPGAKELLEALEARGKLALVVTNGASRLPETASKRFHALGLPIPPERIVTTGELLPAHFDAHGLRGTRTMVLGPEDAFTFVSRAGGVPVAHDAADAEVLLVADEDGFPFLEGVDAALSLAIRHADAGVPLHLLLPNQDLIYPKPRGFGITSGSIATVIEAALAQRYPGRGLTFARLGKPEPGLFAEAVRRAGTRDLLMIGDQLATDIAGARAFGLDAALLLGPSSVAGGDPREGPTFVLRSLQ